MMKIRRLVVILGVIFFGIALALFWKDSFQCVSSAGAVSAGAVPAVKSPDQPQAVSRNIADIYREAEALQKEGRLTEAVALYEKAEAVLPGAAETYFRLGILYFQLNFPSRAEEFYQKAVRHGQDTAEVYFHLGYIEEVRGALDRALTYYLKSEEKGSHNPALFYNIGNTYARLEKNEDAVHYYKRTVSIDPQHMDSFVNLSVVSFKMKEYADARFYLDKAVALGYKAPEEYLKVLDQK